MVETPLEALPRECLSHAVSFTSPCDACRWSLVAQIFREAAESDFVWEKFLPLDYREIISRSVFSVDFTSKKDLYRKLSSTPLLVDGGKMTFSLDKRTNKKCYMLSARELSIAWSTHPLCWCWKPFRLQSRFPEAVELIMVSWLQITGQISTQMLSPNTTYGAYLVIQVVNRAFGLGVMPMEVSVEAADYTTRGTIRMNPDQSKGRGSDGEGEMVEREICQRGDGWLEVELGEFYNDGCEKEVKMEFKEIEGQQLKGGIVVEGIELRPKY